MSKTIKVSDETKEALEKLQQPRETFDGVVQRLLRVHASLQNVSDILGPVHYLKSPNPPGYDPVREAALDRQDLETRRLK